MGETQPRETPTARPALASSPCYLNPALLEDAWLIPMAPAERIGGRHARWNHPRDISLCRSFSARRRRLRRAGGRHPAVVLSGSTSTVPHGRQPKTATYYLSSYSSSPRRNSGITVTTIATTIATSITAPV